jgi:hypothetical protein
MYTNRGKFIRAYTLEELYSQEQIFELPLRLPPDGGAVHSGWRSFKSHNFRTSGGMFSFEVEKGTFEYHAGTESVMRWV